MEPIDFWATVYALAAAAPLVKAKDPLPDAEISQVVRERLDDFLGGCA